MDYLVTMTTHVPPGIPPETVDDVRARESSRAHELAAQGHLLRLWRPPVHPGEWRTLGLFAAGDAEELEQALASMPLRVWRTDEVTALSPHPNDPVPAVHNRIDRATASDRSMEFLTTFTVTIPPGVAAEVADDLTAREADRARVLAEQGHLERLWTLPATPGQSRALGLWQAQNPAEMQEIVQSLPLDPWMRTEMTPLTEHPNDPAIAGG